MSEQPSESRPNVLLICVDHWPGRFLGALGHPTLLTPSLDVLAASGVIYTHAYSTTPTCIPARRAMYTGTFSPTHGDRIFNETLPMPGLPLLAQTFRDAGYQAYAVGKMHVYPQRDRVGFDDVLLNEEGRHHLGLSADDYELFLAEQGYAGQELTHGMGNNDYCTRSWHLPESCHPTNWTAREMCKVIRRRDPTRPGFWYMSFNHPHPPLVPLAEYMEVYRHMEIDMPHTGDWAQHFDDLPYALKARRHWHSAYGEQAIRLARQAFYALCTHIDHQIRLVVGMLREEGLLDDTILLFTCDHGDLLGNHGLYAKGVFYDDAAKIPMILVPTPDDERVGHHKVDDRLASLSDVMPTLLDLCGIPIPQTVEGLSLVGEQRHETLYGEHYENARATRMIHDGRHKLIYYPVGNKVQLFDLKNDPDEMVNVASFPAYARTREELTQRLIPHLHGDDLEWVEDGQLVGLPDIEFEPGTDRGLGAQRGWRFL